MAGVLLALKFAVPAAVVAAEQAAGSSGLVGLLKGEPSARSGSARMLRDSSPAVFRLT